MFIEFNVESMRQGSADRLRVRPPAAYPPGRAPLECGVAVRAEAMSGSLSGAWRDDMLIGVNVFCDELAQLYETLSGEAKRC